MIMHEKGLELSLVLVSRSLGSRADLSAIPLLSTCGIPQATVQLPAYTTLLSSVYSHYLKSLSCIVTDAVIAEYCC